jgi:hypothetical protein
MDDARFDYLVSLKVRCEEKARSSEGRHRRQLEKLAATYNDMAAAIMIEAAVETAAP